jgi:hypothetical protein
LVFRCRFFVFNELFHFSIQRVVNLFSFGEGSNWQLVGKSNGRERWRRRRGKSTEKRDIK